MAFEARLNSIVKSYFFAQKGVIRCLLLSSISNLRSRREIFEKCSILFKAKKDENFNRRNTPSILRINPPKFGGGLKFESDPGEIGFIFHRANTEIGQKGTFYKGLTLPILLFKIEQGLFN